MQESTRSTDMLDDDNDNDDIADEQKELLSLNTNEHENKRSKEPKRYSVRLFLSLVIICSVVCSFLFAYDAGGLSTSTSSLSTTTTSNSTTTTTTTVTDGNLTASTAHRIKYIPFPHKSLGALQDAECRWTTGISTATASLLSDNNKSDSIQQAALNEGMCLPLRTKHHWHLYSTAEAIRCLSPTIQKRPISVIITGDSYNKQLYIGLTDIILSRPWNIEMTTKTRTKLLLETNALMKTYHANDPSFPNIQFVCGDECYGDRLKPFSFHCASCINAFTTSNENTAAIVGAGVHILHDKQSVSGALEEITSFFNQANRIIFNSMPSYDLSMVPLPFRNLFHHTHADRFYYETMPYLFPANKSRPYLDFYQLTKACVSKNCTTDGGHRSRFVNRWKAQVLLNTICSFE